MIYVNRPSSPAVRVTPQVSIKEITAPQVKEAGVEIKTGAK
jgi:hypothetical protein